MVRPMVVSSSAPAFYRRNPAGFGQPRRVERLESLIDEVANFLTAARAVEPMGLPESAPLAFGALDDGTACS